jgi:ParB-like chromosome segregation protein Spo0J
VPGKNYEAAMATKKPKRKLELVYVNPRDLVPYLGNPWHNDMAVEAVKRSIETFGFIDPIIARRSDKMIVAGHTRTLSALRAGVYEVPVIYVDMNDEDMKLYNIADNKLGEYAAWDTGELARIMQELSEKEIDLSLTFFSDTEIDELLGGVESKELLEERTEEIRAYKKTHVLLSFPPEKIIDLQELLVKIRTIEGVEYEQCSN